MILGKEKINEVIQVILPRSVYLWVYLFKKKVINSLLCNLNQKKDFRNYVGLLITNKTNVRWDSYYAMYMPYCFHLLIHKDKQKKISTT